MFKNLIQNIIQQINFKSLNIDMNILIKVHRNIFSSNYLLPSLKIKEKNRT